MANTISIPSNLPNATIAIQKIIEALPNDGSPVTIKFEPGIHNFYIEGATKHSPKLSNNTFIERNIAIPIIDRKNITIDGEDATLLFHELMTPFFIKNSSSVTIKNLTINFSIPLYIDAIVESFDEKHLSLAIDRNEYEYTVEGSPAAITFKTPDGQLCSRDNYFNIIRIDERKSKVRDWGILNAFLFIGDCTNNPVKLPAGRMFADVEETPTGIKLIYRPECPYRPFKVGEHLFIRNLNSIETPNVIIENSAELNFEGVTMLAGPGMGFLGQMSHNLTFDHVKVIPAEGKNISTDADAIHLVQCSGKVIVRNCKITHALDDALNVHGNYFKVGKVISNDKIIAIAAAWHHKGFVPYSIGDELVFNTPEPLMVKGKATITAIETNEDESEITLSLDRDISSFVCEGDFIENPNHLPELLFENNIIDDIPEIRIATTKKVIIQGNTFNLCCLDLHFNDLTGFWWESSPSTDVEIRNNTFVRHGPNIGFDSFSTKESGRWHKKAVISKNNFADPEKAVRSDKLLELIFEK